MNSKGHLLISLAKSAVRVIGSVISLIRKSPTPLALGIMFAEIGGVLEEIVDKR